MPNAAILRLLDPGKAFFMADHLSCMNFVVMAERTGHLDPQRIRAGLAVLQAANPLLRTRIVWSPEDGLCFVAAPGQPIVLECRSIAGDDWLAAIEGELARPFANQEAPLVRCLYLEMVSPERSVLALCFHHAVADGRSGTELLQRLLDCIARGEGPGAEADETHLPPMYEVFPPQFRWAEQPDTAEQVMDQLMGDYKRRGRLTPLPWLARTAPARTPKIIRLRFSPEATQGLVDRCRAHGTSVHGALCAAQLMSRIACRRPPSRRPCSCVARSTCVCISIRCRRPARPAST